MTVPAPIDAYDKLYTYCDNTGNPTTFIDACSTPKTITANGNATQLPIKFNKSAGFFNGTTNYVVVPNSSDFQFGSGDFQIDVWVFVQDISIDRIIIGKGGGYAGWNADNGHEWLLTATSSGKLRFQYNQNNGATPATHESSSVTLVGGWHHVQYNTVSGNYSFVLDDVTVGSGSGVAAILPKNTTQSLIIGVDNGGSNFFKGWLKNLTVTKASTLVLDMRFDTPATSPLGPAIAFDGTGDWLDVASSTDFNFGTGAFTIEFWMQPASVSIGDQVILDRNLTNDFVVSQHVAELNFGIGGGAVISCSGITANRWYHVAAVRIGTGTDRTKIFLDGREVASGTFNNNISSSSILRIGAETNGNYPWSGSLREIRISNVARYTSAFTPSQSGFTVDANTVLYIKGNENNGTTTFIDSETTPKTVTTNGDTKIKYTEDYRSCIFKDETGKFPYPVGSAKVDFFAIGSGVGYFDGSGDYLTVPDSDDWDLTTNTYEMYFRPSTIAANGQGLIAHLTDGSNYYCFSWVQSDAKFHFYQRITAGFEINLSWSYTPSVNSWHHVAFVKEGNDYEVFVNGISLGTVTNATSIINQTDKLYLGYSYTGADQALTVNGLLDNIRISKGVARYTAAFNPPDYGQGAAGSANYGRFFLVF